MWYPAIRQSVVPGGAEVAVHEFKHNKYCLVSVRHIRGCYKCF